MNRQDRDAALESYLDDVAGRLQHLSTARREDILAGLREHAAELHDAGMAGPEVLARLGGADEVARAAASELPEPRRRFLDAKRWVQLGALAVAVWAVWALTGATALEGIGPSDGVTYFGMGQGAVPALAIVVAIVPLVLTAAPLAVVGGRGRQSVSVACTAVLGVVTAITGITVGAYLVAPLVVAAVACIVPPRR